MEAHPVLVQSLREEQALSDRVHERPSSTIIDNSGQLNIRNRIKEQQRLLNYLAERGFAIDPPVVSGSSLLQPTDNPSTVPRSSRGRGMYWEDPAQVSRAAIALATLHRLAGGYAYQPNSGSSFVKAFHQELAVFFDDSESLDGSLDDLRIVGSMQLFRDIAIQLEHLVSNLGYESLPKLFIHGDYSPPNVAFEDGERVRILELDGTRYEAKVLDIAIALAHLPPGAYDSVFLDSTRIFFTSYNEIFPLNELERAALPVLIAAQITHEAFQGIHEISRSLDEIEPHQHARRFRGLVSRLWWLVENWSALKNVFEESHFEPANEFRPVIRTGSNEEDLDQR